MDRRHKCDSMADVRQAIDAIDRLLVGLIADRLYFIEEAARIKETRDAVRDEARIADVLAKVRAVAEERGIDPALVEAVYRTLVERSIAHEFQVFDRLRR